MNTEKTFALFELTMLSVGSCNYRLTGEGVYYAIARRIQFLGKKIFPLLKEGNYSYSFDDGWCANIKVSFVTKVDAQKAERKSGRRFNGYEWMVDSILANGKIVTIPNWTIKDAKDGDVLCSGQIILLFKKWEDTDWNFVIAYAGIDISGRLQITNKHWLISNHTCQATKQQRELLFRKIKEYGYEWDEDIKELKKL